MNGNARNWLLGSQSVREEEMPLTVESIMTCLPRVLPGAKLVLSKMESL